MDDLEQVFPLSSSQWTWGVNLPIHAASPTEEKHVLSLVCSMSAKLKSPCCDNVCVAKYCRCSAGMSGERREAKQLFYFLSWRGRKKARMVRFYLQHSLQWMIPNNRRYVLCFISRCFLLSAFYLLVASSDVVTAFLKWQTTLAVLNL